MLNDGSVGSYNNAAFIWNWSATKVCFVHVHECGGEKEEVGYRVQMRCALPGIAEGHKV